MIKNIVKVLAHAAVNAALLVTSPAWAAQDAQGIVVADFDYSDTSGEVRDQTAEHAERVAAFGADLAAALAKQTRREARRITCGAPDCSVDALGAERLVAAAKASTARFLVYGGIHKASTLVEFAKVEMIDMKTDKVIASKLLTFRGDSGEAFRRAAQFVADDLLAGAGLP